jgi:hypothetical protein
LGIENVNNMIKALVNDIECIFYYDERFSPEHAPLGYPYMYHLRHDEDDWTRPISIEKYVLVNFFGTVFMKNPIDFGNEIYMDINKFKMGKNHFVKIRLRKDTINGMLHIGNSKSDE